MQSDWLSSKRLALAKNAVVQKATEEGEVKKWDGNGQWEGLNI